MHNYIERDWKCLQKTTDVGTGWIRSGAGYYCWGNFFLSWIWSTSNIELATNGCVDPIDNCEPCDTPGNDCCELNKAGARPVAPEEVEGSTAAGGWASCWEPKRGGDSDVSPLSISFSTGLVCSLIFIFSFPSRNVRRCDWFFIPHRFNSYRIIWCIITL